MLLLKFIASKGLVETVEITEHIKRTDRTARRIVKALEEKGLITWVGINEKDLNKNIKYRINSIGGILKKLNFRF